MSGKRGSDIFKILDLWFYNDQEWMRFKDVKERTGISERTLVRRLNKLVKGRVLEKNEEKGYRPFHGSSEENLLRALEFAKTRESWQILDTNEKKLEIAQRVMKAHLDFATTEIANIALQVFEGNQKRIMVDEGLAMLWINSFLADFYGQLTKMKDFLLELYIKECQGKKRDVVEISRKLAFSISSILRSYADMSLKLYRDSKPVICKRENGTTVPLPPLSIKEIGQCMTKAIRREEMEKVMKQKCDKYFEGGLPKMLARQVLRDLVWIPSHHIDVKINIENDKDHQNH